jgi:hypothetical protein
MRTPFPSALEKLFQLFLLMAVSSVALEAQASDESAGTAVLGGALGAYSGAALGLAASLVPCNRVLAGRRCVRVSSSVGGALGLIAGAVLGARDEGRLHHRLRGSGYGALAGGVVGLGLRSFVRQYGWADVGAASAMGAAIGASATGAGLGFAAGAIPGVLLWKVFGVIDTSDAVALSLAGLALGGLVGWVTAAGVDPNRGATPVQLVIPLGVSF